MRGFNYCGFDSEEELGIFVEDAKKDIIGSLTATTTNIPARIGELYQGITIGSKAIELKCFLPEIYTAQEKAEALRNIAGFIGQTTDGELYPLILAGEEDVTYWVYPSAISGFDNINQNSFEGSFTITFGCPESKSYGELIEQPLTKASTVLNAEGTAPTGAILTLEAGQNLKKIGVSDENGDFVYIGSNFELDDADTTVNMKPRILYDPCNTLASWTKVTPSTLTFNIENGDIATDANISATANALVPTKKNGKPNFGTNPNGSSKTKWYGAVRQQYLTTACDDWIIRARFKVDNNYGRARNKIELYLLDSVGRRIGKIMIKDNGNSMENDVAVQIGYNYPSNYKMVYNSATDKKVKTTKKNTLGNKDVIFKKSKTVKVKKTTTTKSGKKKTETVSKKMTEIVKYDQSNEENTFTDFYGYVELRKVGNKYTAVVQKLTSKGVAIKNGKFTSKTYTDSSKKFGDRLAGIAVYVAKLDIDEDAQGFDYKPNSLALADVRVWNVLGAVNEVVAEAGDEIVIDCDNKTVYRNGVVYMENIYIGSVFPTLDPNEEQAYAVSPVPSATNKWSLSYHPKFY